MELTLIRHGESIANTGASIELDTPLTLRGQKQAAITARRLSDDAEAIGPFIVALASPLRRTLMTCEQIHRSLDVPSAVYYHACEYISVDEPRYSNFAALTPAEVRSEFPWIDVAFQFAVSGSRDWWPPRLESRHDVCERAQLIRRQLSKRFSGAERVIVISHAETIGRLVEAYTLAEPADYAPMTNNCGMWRLRVAGSDAPAEVLLANDTSHLIGIN